MNNKFLKKVEIIISIYTAAPNFSQSGKLQILGPNLFKKNMNEKNFKKINVKIIISI